MKAQKYFFSVIFFLSLSGLLFEHTAAQESADIQIYRDQDTFTLYLPAGTLNRSVSLGGLRFEVGESRISYPFVGFRAFAGIALNRLSPPICFRLKRYGSHSPLPLSCDGIPVLTHELADYDVFWYSREQGQDLTVIIGGGMAEEICPAGQAHCELHFAANTSALLTSALPDTLDPSLVTQVNGSGAIINITGGTVGAVINQSTVQELIINIGDSEAEQAAKSRQRADLISAEVQQLLRNVDSRLLLVDNTLDSDLFDSRLAEIRATVAPGAEGVFAGAYDELLARTQVIRLREAFTSTPLPSVANPAVVALVAESSVNPFDLQFFYNQLNEINVTSNNLIERLESLTNALASDPAWLSYQQDSLALETQTLLNRSMLAYVTALRILGDLKHIYPDMMIPLGSFVYLEPPGFLSEAELDTLYQEHLAFALDLVSSRAFLVAEGEQLLDSTLDDYARVSNLLIIYPDDTWDQVVGKAISLRQLGRVTEAVAAFAQYGYMFAPADPTALQYSVTAQHFTLQAQALGIARGAAYVYAVAEDSPAAEAGLQAGDILVEYDGQDLTGVIMDNGEEITLGEFISNAFAQVSAGDEISITYLRLNADHTFSRQTTTVIVTEVIGMGVMPV